MIRQIAVGGMAELYLTRTVGIEGFEKLACVKRILPQYVDNPSFVAMFLNEARLAATLQHPNIAQVYDIGQEAGEYFFSMEYVHGEDLGLMIATGREHGVPISLDCALTLGAGLCAGLHHAHDRTGPDGKPMGIVHRDVSPTNVLVSYDGAVKLVDFGLARTEPSTGSSYNGLKGKVAYMSPEQCRGRAVLDRRSDVFSVGTILYELTTGQLPFVDDSEYGVLHQIVNRDAARPSTLVPDYPPALEAIVMRALARDPDQRYATALELQHQLEDFAHDHRLRVSALVLARLMSTLFPARLEDWDTARAQGAFFVEQHVVRTLIENGKTADRAARYTPEPLPVVEPSSATPVAADPAQTERTQVGPPAALAGRTGPPAVPLPPVPRGPASPSNTPTHRMAPALFPSQPSPRAAASQPGAAPSRTGSPSNVPTQQMAPVVPARSGSAAGHATLPRAASPSVVPTQQMAPVAAASPRPDDALGAGGEASTIRGVFPRAGSPSTLRGPGAAPARRTPTELTIPSPPPAGMQGPPARSPSTMPPPRALAASSSPAVMLPAATPIARTPRQAPVPNMPGAVPIMGSPSGPPVPSGGTLVSSATQAGPAAPRVLPLPPGPETYPLASGLRGPDSIPDSALGFVGIQGPGPSGARGSDPGAPASHPGPGGSYPGGRTYGDPRLAPAQGGFGSHTGVPTPPGLASYPDDAGDDFGRETAHRTVADLTERVRSASALAAAARPTLVVRRQRPLRWPLAALALVGALGVGGAAWLVLDHRRTGTEPAAASPAPVERPTGPAVEHAAEPPAAALPSTAAAAPSAAAAPDSTATAAPDSAPAVPDSAAAAPPTAATAPPIAATAPPTTAPLDAAKPAKALAQEPRAKAKPARIRIDKRPSRPKAEPKEQPWNDDSPFLPVPTPKR